MTNDERPGSGGAGPRLPRRQQLFILAACSLVLAVLIGLGLWINHRDADPEPKEAPPPRGTFRPTKEQLAALKIALVKTIVFRTEQATDGNIAVNEEATTPVFSQYSGRVTKLLAKVGDFVHKGAPLMEVEAAEFVQAQNDVVSTAAALSTARKQTELAVANEGRQHALYDAQAGALKDWLQSQTDLVSAQNALRSANTAFEAARNRLRILGKSDAEIDVLERGGATQKAKSSALVTAPITGTVTQRQVGLGQYIASAASGGTALVFAVSDLSTVWLIANVRETDAPYVRIGQAVEVHVLAFPGRVFKAKINWIGSSLDPNTHRLPVRAEVENRDGALKPMMFASFNILTSGEAAAPAVPRRALVREGDQTRVYVAGADGNIALREIRTGRVNDSMVEVVSGLRAGEQVVTDGALFIDRAVQDNQY